MADYLPQCTILHVYSKAKSVLKNFTKFTGRHFRPAILLKKSLWHRCFPVKIAKFLRAPFLQNTSGDCFCILIRVVFRILLNIYDEAFWENSSRLKAVNYFRMNVLWQMFDSVLDLHLSVTDVSVMMIWWFERFWKTAKVLLWSETL